ncbi:hypothetical protein POM88_015782 [Heracleum sosnowskyi]|uniref:SANT domain-containing protein n=1 Tax=Heracleum sosnowskyi TaxID=360622 RepID=A0AAD8MWI4_9APIA|nr:hypothetical protein POM88_015782 [Heracleum sosnowskyi]
MVSPEVNQNGDNIDNISAEQLLPIDSSYACGVFGESKLLPRIGDEYLAQIPSFLSGPEYDCYLKRLIDAEKKDHVPFDFWLGLSVPVTWNNYVNKANENIKNAKQGFSFASVRETIDSYQGSSYSLIPGVCGDAWNDIEKTSFLLGVHIFKKKFVHLKRFIGSKKMGDVLLFYYSKFYSSIEYNRWSTCRKGRRRKCVSGQLLISGLRQQELVSRLLSRVSEECQKALIEVTKTYAKKDVSLIEYVFSIKSMVGLETFVDAVGIGKGKEDLTSMDIGPVRIPIGKACSYLTCTEIVNFLTGGYRLSKAQSSDLFWEAVWPLLLGRGWQSEKPKNQAYVPDVLDKISSEPELLKLPTENDEGKKKDEDRWIEEIKEPQNLHKKRQCCLQPQKSICDMDDRKFTVVDTSLDNGIFLKFREPRTLPMDISKKKIVPKDGDQGTSNSPTNISDCAHNMLMARETNSTARDKITSDTGKFFDSSSDQLVHSNVPDSMNPVRNAKKQKTLYEDQQSRKPVDIHLRQKLKRSNLNTSTSVTKRYRTIAACSEEIGSSRSTIPLLPEFGDHVRVCCSDIHDPNKKASIQASLSKDSLASTNSRKGSPCGSTGGSQENTQSRMFPDSNLPQQPVDFPNSFILTNSANMQNDITSTRQDDFCKTSADISAPEQPPNINSRRQSTRNRPPTARALEALVNGDLTAKKKRR